MTGQSLAKRLQEVGACPDCRGPLASEDTRPGKLVCATCGFVVNTRGGVASAMPSSRQSPAPATGGEARSSGWADGIAADMDGKAETYRRKYDSYTILSRGFILRRRHALDLLGSAPGRVLEAGCGPGILGPLLSPSGRDVHGVDLSIGQLRVAAQRDPATLYVWGDLERLPYQDGVFDTVALLGVLEYCERPRDVLRELARVTARRGQVVISVPNVRALPRLWTQHVWIPLSQARSRVLGRRVPSYSRRLFSVSGLATDLQLAGFRLQETRFFELCPTPPPLDRLLRDGALQFSEAMERSTRGLIRQTFSNQIIVRATRTAHRESGA